MKMYNTPMKSLSTSFKKSGNLHHAYILEGHHHSIYPSLCQFCEKELKFKTRANPDFYYEVFERFSVSDARKLHEMQMRKTTNVGRKIFIIAFTFITKEAQNALLKVLEEPTEGTHFFFITTNTKTLLDTVLSRVVHISDMADSSLEEVEEDARKFLKSSYKKRMDFVAGMVGDIQKEKKSKADVLFFLQSLEHLIHQDFLKDPDKEKARGLKEVHLVETYIHDQGSSAKQLLEHISLVV